MLLVLRSTISSGIASVATPVVLCSPLIIFLVFFQHILYSYRGRQRGAH
jgi:hypothetical protein